ncbi:MAG: acyl-CoA dehydrogenase family protein, partial [Rhodobacterales bacterium]|nr:acyl-CoA dehydrogenase family protein [Rhodobacterales bacterium]
MEPETEDWVENVRMLAESARAVVPADGTLGRVRAARFIEPGFSPDVWATIVEMGWLGIRLREDFGGLDLGVREAVALSEILGGGLVPEPVLPAILALGLLTEAGQGAAIDSALGGETLVMPAWQATPDGLDPADGVTVSGGRLRGAKIAVAGGAGADLFAVTTAQGLALVPRDAAGLTVTAQSLHDGTFQARLDFDDVAVDLQPCAAMADLLSEALLLHAGFLLGMSERAFAVTLEYLRVRKQFGVAIG